MDSQPRTVRRLKASLGGTNLELTGDYNQRLVYQAIRAEGPVTRGALTDLTRLAKPTIAGIVRRMLDSDLVVETGRIYGGRGQPAVHLEINPAGCYAIGLRTGAEDSDAVLIDAAGTMLQHAAIPAPGEPDFASAFAAFLDDARTASHDRIIGLGVVRREPAPAAPDGDEDRDLLILSEAAPAIPIYLDSALGAATAGETLFGMGGSFKSYYYILMGINPVGGLVVNQALFKGAHPDRMRRLFPDREPAWCREAIAAARGIRPGQTPPDCSKAWLAAACDDLLPLLGSLNCMLNPGGVLMGGPFPTQWLARLAARCDDLLDERAPHIPSHAGIQPARLGSDATLVGAASLPMRARLFPIEEALLKGPDRAG
jgi:predicted NBD/HSP70 family sugar kinase